uniref:mucin-5AC n=1 Tax=Vespula vulgaris TaxID=7454 RepID=UPI00213D352B|nr:mucin-5AC [Vespula vulgaris]
MKTIRTIVWLVLPITSCLALPPSQQEHARGSVRAKQTTPTLPNRITSVITSTTIPSVTSSSSSIASSSMSSVTTPIPTSSSSATTITTSSSSTNPIVSIASTEQIMSRTAATSGSGSTVFLSSTRKVSTKLDESTSTMASTSGKETRESPGKIRPQIKLTTNYTSASETGVRLPEGASAALAKPTKYHYYPHNQHIYLLPECAVQQVCNAVYVRLNFTQPLCACPGRYRDPCSASLDSDDHHTTELVTDPRTKALTLVKTCEPVAEMRECRAPRDWSLLALQNTRTGKSHYLVICRCPDSNILEGPMSHDQPTYASVPGIRVYGMMCVQGNRRGRPLRHIRSLMGFNDLEENTERFLFAGEDKPEFPWDKVHQLMKMAVWE